MSIADWFRGIVKDKLSDGVNNPIVKNVGDWFVEKHHSAQNFLDGSSRLGGNLKEFFQGPSDYSTAGMQRQENLKDRAFNAEQAQINREFQERMSNTSLQRGMQDAKTAGINPIYTAGSGGASVPSGSAGHSGASGTKDSNISGAIGKIAAMVLGSVTAGARISQMSNNSMAKILSNEKIASLKNSTALMVGQTREEAAKQRAEMIAQAAMERTKESAKHSMERTKYTSDSAMERATLNEGGQTYIMNGNGEIIRQIDSHKFRRKYK